MIYDPAPLAVILFISIVALVLGISIYFARKTSSAKGYFAAGGTIPWTVNGVAFAGDYLSAASFLGICGLIATVGYDGFLYSIGYLAGWMVALFVVAEPLKRLGRYTFADALDAKFNSKGIQLMAGISTLVVSIFYLIPQMVGAGALVTPLLGLPHWAGVVIVGAIVTFIVATAGMKSTTYVQFIKGTLLIIFSFILVIVLLNKGLDTTPDYERYRIPEVVKAELSGEKVNAAGNGYLVKGQVTSGDYTLVVLEKAGLRSWWNLDTSGDSPVLMEAVSKTQTSGGEILYNGAIKTERKFHPVGRMSRIYLDGENVEKTGKLNVISYLRAIQNGQVIRYAKKHIVFEGDNVTVWAQNPTSGAEFLRPGLKYKLGEGASIFSKLDFVSLMLALFLGTAALPHVLIRYYTVPSPRDARRSTIVAIAAIGFFYILTLYMGLGAATSGVLDVESSNMAAPLLAKSFGTFLFAIISAIAFATVLGTVSGLIVASSGAVAHDLMDRFAEVKFTDKGKVKAAKFTAVIVGGVAILLGILFKGMNVSFLVGWAFAVAASANLPSIVMMLFWKKTTAQGITYSILVGAISALTLILLSPSMFERYGIDAANAPIPFDNPGIISIPLSFITIIVVSLLTQKKSET
ncbi:MAG: cation acetate symporter [Spirochaetes bacterium]|nr:MAG: cation acetate symporter [Spirochaetota bacterium]RKX98485.1 MAG: cation acetate symporter [Spirochaetota bacterium]